MRPITLSMQAFGPYSERQELDFSELGNHRFFLIHGPTGSGKTSILDAICFALYGEMSGSGREGDRMRSQYARPDLPMEVSFEFAVGEKRYRVTRSPAQQVEVKGKPRETAHKAELYAFAGDRWEALATGPARVAEQVEAVLGFRGEQFRQVVVIPQGDFRKLLTSTSRDREEILRVLLRVDGFRAIEDLLKRRARALEEELDRLNTMRDVLLGEADAGDPEALRLRMERNAAEYAALQGRVAGARALLDACRNATAEGRAARAKADEAEAAAKALDGLNGRAGAVESMKAALGRAEAAATLADAETGLARRRSEMRKAEEEAARAGRRRLDAQTAYGAAGERLRLERDGESERNALAQTVYMLEEALPKATRLEQLRRAEEAAKAAAESSRNAQDQAAGALARNDATQQALARDIAATEPFAAELAARKYTFARLTAAAGKRRELAQMEEELEKIAGMADAGYLECDAAQNKLDSHIAGHRQARKAWDGAQAALLAGSLAEGSPCPVCGSTHHPVKAAMPEGTPSQTELDRMDDLETEYRGDLETKRARLNKLILQRTELTAKAGASRADLAEWASPTPQAIEREAAEAGKQFGEAEEAARRLEKLKAELKAAADARQELEARRRQAQADRDETLAAHTRSAAELAAAAAGLPEGLRDRAAAERMLSESKKRSDTLRRNLEEAVRREQECARNAASAEAELKAARAALASAMEAYEREKDGFINRLGDSGFDSAESYQAAKRPLGERERWKTDIEAYHLSLAAARDRLLRAQTEAAGGTPPDIAALEARERQASGEYEAAVRAHTAMGKQLESEKAWSAKLQELDGRSETLQKRYAVAGELAKVALGGNPFGLTLQRFVLGALFDEVAVAATARLRVMSRGRYMLQRTMERARANASGGLDLEVFDEYTGDSRPVSTLSGGESFLASLALALGLADVVQAHSGGTYLETIFVDEGFGSLDPEALDEALNALIDLQSAGRLVGIISHVPELKERIGARLEIRPGERGSIASFVVG